MNDYQTYQKIIKQHPNQKAIIASGFSKNNAVTAALQLDAHRFIRKPYSMGQLGIAVNLHWKGSKASSGTTHGEMDLEVHRLVEEAKK